VIFSQTHLVTLIPSFLFVLPPTSILISSPS
jgi:hypothetical protein